MGQNMLGAFIVVLEEKISSLFSISLNVIK